MSIASLGHVCLKSTDLKKTSDFYCGVLGMKKAFDFTKKGDVIGYYMQADNRTFVEVFRADAVAELGLQVLNHFCLETPDIKALREKVVAAGYTPGEIKMGADNAYQFWMKDPNGLNIEFHQYTEKCSQFTGQDVEVNW